MLFVLRVDPPVLIILLPLGRTRQTRHLFLFGLFTGLEGIFEFLVDQRDFLQNVLRDRIPEVSLIYVHAPRSTLSVRAQLGQLRGDAGLVVVRLHAVHRLSRLVVLIALLMLLRVPLFCHHIQMLLIVQILIIRYRSRLLVHDLTHQVSER